jgi:hypothetical protein
MTAIVPAIATSDDTCSGGITKAAPQVALKQRIGPAQPCGLPRVNHGCSKISAPRHPTLAGMCTHASEKQYTWCCPQYRAAQAGVQRMKQGQWGSAMHPCPPRSWAGRLPAGWSALDVLLASAHHCNMPVLFSTHLVLGQVGCQQASEHPRGSHPELHVDRSGVQYVCSQVPAAHGPNRTECVIAAQLFPDLQPADTRSRPLGDTPKTVNHGECSWLHVSAAPTVWRIPYHSRCAWGR